MMTTSNIKDMNKLYIEDFFKSLGNSLFLSDLEDDTSLRQAYLLLDNSIEQFLKSYIKKEKNRNFNIKHIKFHELIEESKKHITNAVDILDRFLDFHETRNDLYHSPTYLTVTKSHFKKYLMEIIALCIIIGFNDINNIILQKCNSVIGTVYSWEDKYRLDLMNKHRNQLEYYFNSPGIADGDIMLGSSPGYSAGAIDVIKTLITGLYYRDDVEDKEIKILEVTDGNKENAFHNFYISNLKSLNWFIFHKCVWSKWGKGERHHIIEIRDIINRFSDKIDYKLEYMSENFLPYVFDPLYENYGNDRYHKRRI